MAQETKKPVKKTPVKKENLFDQLASINVNNKTEKRNNFTYLSWAWAWSEFKKACPDAQFEIIKNPENGKLYTVDEFGILVQTRVTTNGETHEMWLPVMDMSNNAQKSVPYEISFRSGKKITVQPATMMDINKALMRCLVKNLAMFGLGIYIYAGEDLPDGYVMPKPSIEKSRFKSAIKAIFDGTFTEDQLLEKFALTDAQKKELENSMIELEKNIEEMTKEVEQPDDVTPKTKKS